MSYMLSRIIAETIQKVIIQLSLVISELVQLFAGFDFCVRIIIIISAGVITPFFIFDLIDLCQALGHFYITQLCKKLIAFKVSAFF